MSDLHERLNSALATVEPGPAPVDAVMKAGQWIRTRRRAALLTGAVAVVAAAVVGVPAFAHHAAAPAPVTGRIRVTVNPPGPHAAPGLIASGFIGSAAWNLSVTAPTTKNCEFTGAGLSFLACNGDLSQPTASQPISFEGISGTAGSTPDDVSFGEVRADVVSARVELSDGTALTLRPAEVDGLRFMAFAVPSSLTVSGVTAYGKDGGEMATAIPYQALGGLPSFDLWQAPGQLAPPRVNETFPLAAATAEPSQVAVHIGPWGTCLFIGDDGYCFTPAQSATTDALGLSAAYVLGTATDSVSFLVVTPKHGAPIRVPAVIVGHQKFWAVALRRQAQSGARWTAYNAAGHPVTSGTLS